MPEPIIRTLPWTAPSTWITVIAAIIFLALGARAVLAPAGAAAFFGVPLNDEAGFAFVRAFGGRNIGLALTALALVILDNRVGLSALLLAAGLVAAIDAYAVSAAAGFSAAAKHVAYTIALGGFGTWLLARN